MKDDVQRYAGRSQTLSENAARVSTLVSMAASDMERATGGEKIPLNDLDRVRETSTAYLRECADNGVLPTVRGCAARLGCSRQALYDIVKRRPDGEFARWLEDFSDVCGELTMAAALEGTVAAVPAIFTAKARYSWREAPAQLEVGPINPLTGTSGEPGELADAIAAKYSELPSD